MKPPALLLGLLLAAHAADAPKPNIIDIMAGDHGRQAISAYGSKLIQTPQIDRLAREGVRFDQAFANNSICSPTWKGGPFWEYFDLAQDLLEMHNLDAAPSEQGKVAELKMILRKLTGQYRDTAATQLLDDSEHSSP